MTAKRDHRRLIYWDACIFFAWIKQETCWPPEVTKGIEQTIEQAYAKQLIIVTSVVTLTEVLQSNMKADDKERYRNIFKHPNLQLMDVDRRVAEKAAFIREAHDSRAFDKTGKFVSGSIMSLGDSFHLATAAHHAVSEFHTLDGSGRRKRKFDLLALNGNVAGSPLTITAPRYIEPPKPLEGPTSSTTTGEQQELPLEIGVTDIKDVSGLLEDRLEKQGGAPKDANTEGVGSEPENIIASSAEIRGSDNGHPEDQAGAKAVPEVPRKEENQ